MLSETIIKRNTHTKMNCSLKNTFRNRPQIQISNKRPRFIQNQKQKTCEKSEIKNIDKKAKLLESNIFKQCKVSKKAKMQYQTNLNWKKYLSHKTQKNKQKRKKLILNRRKKANEKNRAQKAKIRHNKLQIKRIANKINVKLPNYFKRRTTSKSRKKKGYNLNENKNTKCVFIPQNVLSDFSANRAAESSLDSYENSFRKMYHKRNLKHDNYFKTLDKNYSISSFNKSYRNKTQSKMPFSETYNSKAKMLGHTSQGPRTKKREQSRNLKTNKKGKKKRMPKKRNYFTSIQKMPKKNQNCNYKLKKLFDEYKGRKYTREKGQKSRTRSPNFDDKAKSCSRKIQQIKKRWASIHRLNKNKKRIHRKIASSSRKYTKNSDQVFLKLKSNKERNSYLQFTKTENKAPKKRESGSCLGQRTKNKSPKKYAFNKRTRKKSQHHRYSERNMVFLENCRRLSDSKKVSFPKKQLLCSEVNSQTSVKSHPRVSRVGNQVPLNITSCENANLSNLEKQILEDRPNGVGINKIRCLTAQETSMHSKDKGTIVSTCLENLSKANISDSIKIQKIRTSKIQNADENLYSQESTARNNVNRPAKYKTIAPNESEMQNEPMFNSSKSKSQKIEKTRELSLRENPDKCLFFHEIIGKGTFGIVYLIETIIDRKFFALKIMNKNKLKDIKMTQYIVNEKNIMAKLTHPFIASLNYAFQNDKFLFLIMPYYPKGSLRELIEKSRYLHFDNNSDFDRKANQVVHLPVDSRARAHPRQRHRLPRFKIGKRRF